MSAAKRASAPGAAFLWHTRAAKPLPYPAALRCRPASKDRVHAYIWRRVRCYALPDGASDHWFSLYISCRPCSAAYIQTPPFILQPLPFPWSQLHADGHGNQSVLRRSGEQHPCLQQLCRKLHGDRSARE